MESRSRTAHGVPPWGELRKLAVEAVKADIEAILRNGTGRCLTKHEPLPTPRAGEPLTVTVTLPSGRSVLWREQLFFVIDADLEGQAADHRHPVTYERYAAGQLQLRIPEESRAALRDVHSVRVFYVDDFSLELKRALLNLLVTAPAGRPVAQLWASKESATRDPLPELRTAFELHASQRDALAALTSPGGWFVWGPPGTGKTTVITETVRRALAEDLSVLIASHTHVAVDNVLEGVAQAQLGIDFEGGEIIRVASPRTEEKVSPEVREHEHLLLRKAAAVLNNTTERHEALQQRMDANRADEARAERDVLLQGIAGADASRIEQARRAQAAREDLARLEERRRTIATELASVEERIRTHAQAAATLDVTDAERMAASEDVQRGADALIHAERGLAAAAGVLATAEADRDAIAPRVALAKAMIDAGVARVLPPLRGVRVRRSAALEAELAEATQATEQAVTLNEQAMRHRERCRVAAEAAHAQGEALEARMARAAVERDEAQRLAAEQDEIALKHEKLANESRDLEAIAARVPVSSARSILDEARSKGWIDKLDALAKVELRVAQLDRELEETRREQQTIETDEAETRERLLGEARLVACTLAAYTLNSSLHNRRFDVVILDEASSIGAPEVVLAGSRADRTFAVVGDFLQNAPIAETDSGDAKASELHPWQEMDIFALAGIRDHETARNHQRCVALSSQHRFPEIIAGVVNDFCYDGLLATAESVVQDAGAVITLFDTSGHLDKPLISDGSSWWCRLGLNLLQAIAQRPDLCAGTSFGFISPYRSQADQASRLKLRTAAGAAIECGTAHAFQGRQYDTVVVDLMQDDRPRWIGKADLHGTAHAIAAAKVLNVAVTRTKRRLYLIGDWNFIRRSRSSGMRALAALEGQRDFSVVAAAEILGPACR